MKYWFKRRRYGYGWTPVTFWGWATSISFIAAAISIPLLIFAFQVLPSGYNVASFILFLACIIILFIAITATKAPKPKWRWGKRADDNPDEDF